MEVTITTENFESYKNGELPLVVDLWATWCGPCRQIAPIVSELAEEFDGKIVVGKCDVEENDDIAMEFGVRNIPTILFFKGGQLVDKFVGAASKATFSGHCENTKGEKVTRHFLDASELAPRGDCNCVTRGMEIRPDADNATSGRTENCVGT